jgi:hypothetical protein
MSGKSRGRIDFRFNCQEILYRGNPSLSEFLPFVQIVLGFLPLLIIYEQFLLLD